MKKILPVILLMAAANLTIFLGLGVINNILLCFFCYYILICVGVPVIEYVVIKKSPRELLAALGLVDLKKIRNLAIGLVGGLAIFAAIQIVFALGHQIFFQDNQIVESVAAWNIGRDKIGLIFLIMIPFNGVVEELFWRGYVQGKLQKEGGPVWALVLSTLFFTLNHLFIITSILKDPVGIIIFLAGIAVGGLLWAFSRLKLKSILPAAISHSLATIGYLTVFYVYILK